MPSARHVLAALLVLCALAAGLPLAAPSTSAAVRAEGDNTAALAGELLPQRTQDRLSAGIVSSSSTLLLFQGGVDYDENDPDLTFSVVRRDDGAVLRTFRAPAVDDAQKYRLVDDRLVRLRRLDNARRELEITDAATGTHVHTIDISGRGLIHGDRDWALVSKVGTTTGENALSIIRPDGASTAVPGNFTSPPTWLGGSDDAAYVAGDDGTFLIDTTSGDRTPIPLPDNTRLFAVTPTTLIGSLAGYPEGVPTTMFRAIDRETFEPTWSVDVPTTFRNRGFVSLGEQIGQMYLPDGAPEPAYEHLQLRPVDMATGDLQDPVASDVMAFDQLTDQQVALYFADTPGGRLSIADDGIVTAFGDLPDVHAKVMDIGFSGAKVAASWEEGDAVSTTVVDGTAPWEDSYAAPGFEVGDVEKAFSYGGDVTLVDTGHRVAMMQTYRLTWAGGSREFTANYAILGHGGKFVQRFLYASGGTTEIVDVKSGVTKASYPGTEYGAIDGSTSWRPAESGVLTGTDVISGAVEQVAVPAPCANAGILDVRGRWAQLACTGEIRVINLDQPSRFTTLTEARAHILGDGFVVHVRSKVDGGPPYADVTSLHSGDTRSYGPIRGRFSPPGIAVAVNDTGDARMVYVDPAHQARTVDLSWVAAPPFDLLLTTPPTVTGVARVGSLLRATAAAWQPAATGVTYQWLVGGVVIPGATGMAFAPRSNDVNRVVAVRVTASRWGFATTVVDSEPTAPVRLGIISPLKRPAVSGVARVGRRLTSSAGLWSPSGLTLRYQWFRDGRAVPRATGRSYLLPRSAKGHRFAVRVQATRPSYATSAQTSLPTARVR